MNELAGNHWGNWTEPAVWTGYPEDVNADGTVKSSSAASWSTTLGRTGQNWNGRSANTSSFGDGAWQIFSDECYDGSHVHDGFCDRLAGCELGNTTCISMIDSNNLYNRVGVMFADWIQFSRKHLGMKISLGTETPMTYPPQYYLPSQFTGTFNASLTQRLRKRIMSVTVDIAVGKRARVKSRAQKVRTSRLPKNCSKRTCCWHLNRARTIRAESSSGLPWKLPAVDHVVQTLSCGQPCEK